PGARHDGELEPRVRKLRRVVPRLRAADHGPRAAVRRLSIGLPLRTAGTRSRGARWARPPRRARLPGLRPSRDAVDAAAPERPRVARSRAPARPGDGRRDVRRVSGTLLVTNLLASGAPLADAQAEAETQRELARKARFGGVLNALDIQLDLIRALRGQAARGALGDAHQERRFDAGARSPRERAVWWSWG